MSEYKELGELPVWRRARNLAEVVRNTTQGLRDHTAEVRDKLKETRDRLKADRIARVTAYTAAQASDSDSPAPGKGRLPTDAPRAYYEADSELSAPRIDDDEHQ